MSSASRQFKGVVGYGSGQGGQTVMDKGRRGQDVNRSKPQAPTRHGTANSSSSEVKRSDTLAKPDQHRRTGSEVEGSRVGGSNATGRPRGPPERRQSYAEIARKNSGHAQGEWTTPKVAGPSHPPPAAISRNLSQHSSASSRSSYLSGRNMLHFRDPFDENMTAIRMSFTECEAFAVGFAKETHRLEGLHVDPRKALETHQTATAEGKKAIETHRSKLCRAVAILSEQEHMDKILCDYSGARKTPYGRSEPMRYELLGTNRTAVPLQRRHKGPLTIPREMANTIPDTVEQLLHLLNDVLRTEYALDRPGLESCLQGYLDESCDFGLIYGYLRPWWSRGNFDRITALMQGRKAEDALLRKNALDGDCIVNPQVPPRRVWDLFSNRVLPFYVLPTSSPSTIPANVWAVSHSWKPAEERVKVSTWVNGEAWRVPLPKDTDLHDVRIELLNLGAEYVFLDVLCLRQRDSQKLEQEFRRKKEWRLDVPTIGYVYQHPRITVVYFNGLGEEFNLEPKGGFDSEFHWFQRAWTLQEATEYWLPGGLTQRSLHEVDDPTAALRAATDFSYRLHAVLRYTSATKEIDLFTLLEAIRARHFTNPVDAIAGLAYLLRCSTLPIYNADSVDEEGAWEALIQSMSPLQRLLLLVCWGRADGASGLYTWRPTWHDLKHCEFPLYDLAPPDFLENEDEFLQFVPDAGHQEGSDAYFHYAYVMDHCTMQMEGVQQLSRGVSDARMVWSPSVSDFGDGYDSDATARNLSPMPMPQGVTVRVRAKTGRSYSYRVTKFIHPVSRIHRLLQEPRSREREYTLVGVYGCKYWIVGEKKGSRRIGTTRRVTVLSKTAVIVLDTSSTSVPSPEKENIGHVDMIAYC